MLSHHDLTPEMLTPYIKNWIINKGNMSNRQPTAEEMEVINAYLSLCPAGNYLFIGSRAYSLWYGK